jgi:hypothetical protein
MIQCEEIKGSAMNAPLRNLERIKMKRFMGRRKGFDGVNDMKMMSEWEGA